MPVFLLGAAASCGALLVLAGAGKAYAGARRADGDDAIRRALRVPRPWWHLTEIAVGCVELTVGGVVCAGAYPATGGVAMAMLGAGFCALLGDPRQAVIFRVSRQGDAPFAVHAALAAAGVPAAARSVRIPRPRDRMGTNQRAAIRVIEQ
jgi:hypothetical protein